MHKVMLFVSGKVQSGLGLAPDSSGPELDSE